MVEDRGRLGKSALTVVYIFAVLLAVRNFPGGPSAPTSCFLRGQSVQALRNFVAASQPAEFRRHLSRTRRGLLQRVSACVHGTMGGILSAGVATAAIAQDSIDAARRDEAEDTGMKRLIEEQLYTFFTTQETPMPPVKRTQFRAGISPGPVVKTGLSMRPSPLSSEPHYLDWKTALATALPGFENGIPPDSMRCLGLFSIALDRVLEYLLDDPRLQPVADLYSHAACYGAFIAGCELLVVELRELLVAACVTDGITPAFGQRLEAVVHSMEAIDDGHWFRLAYLGKY
eukprot:jgi/Tetstr1/427482/TSEL_017610.t1